MIYINIVDKWNILFFIDGYTQEQLIYCLKKLDCSKKSIRKALKISKSINSGFTFSQPITSIVCISEATSIDEWFDTLIHELKHIQTHICDYYNVNESGEEAAYLIGYIMKKFIQAWKNKSKL